MDKPKILIQLDTDVQPSVFDGVVAVDSGVDFLFRHGGVSVDTVRDLVHGALFTRGGADLSRSAIFVGGSDVSAAEMVLKAVRETFFGPFRVSVLFDANGSNTTAAAAVLAALEGSGGSLEGAKTAVLAGTGPVGQRVARLLSRLGADVAIGSRSIEKAQATASSIASVTGGSLFGFSTASEPELIAGLSNVSVVVAAGAAGVGFEIARRIEGSDRPERRAPAGDRRDQANRSRCRPRRRPIVGCPGRGWNQDENPQSGTPGLVRYQ
jgi:hypothetical protein